MISIFLLQGHYIKNPDALRTQAVMRPAEKTERLILVSGTPVLNSAMELWPLLRLLDPAIGDKQDFASRRALAFKVGRASKVQAVFSQRV